MCNRNGMLVESIDGSIYAWLYTVPDPDDDDKFLLVPIDKNVHSQKLHISILLTWWRAARLGGLEAEQKIKEFCEQEHMSYPEDLEALKVEDLEEV